MESPNVVCFSHNGQKIITAGFRSDRMLQIFDLHRPGRESTRLQLGKTRRSRDGQKGLGSAISWQPNLLAVGTYSPGSIYLYDDRAQSTEVATIITGKCVVGHGKGHGRKTKHYFLDDELSFSAAKVQWYQSRARGGVTQLEFHQDQCSLFSSSRRSDAVLQWDLRRLSSHAGFCPGVASYATDNETNQRLEFALNDSQVWIGGRDKCVRVYSQTSRKLLATLEDLSDAVNGVSLSTQASGKTLLAVANGSRQFPSEDDLDEEDPSMYPPGANELRLFEVANPAVGA
jgi:WD40 repeat protein